MAEIEFPVPPSTEQKAIVEKFSTLSSGLEKQLKDVETGLNQAEAQRKNILKDAFTGKLVEQDHNDEPASILLEKIKAERELRAKQLKPKRLKKKPSAMNNLDAQTLKNWIINRTEENFTFAQIQSEFNADYDVLKDVVFQTLSEQKAVFEQFFDEDQKQIIFRKINI